MTLTLSLLLLRRLVPIPLLPMTTVLPTLVIRLVLEAPLPIVLTPPDPPLAPLSVELFVNRTDWGVDGR